LVWRP